MTCIFTKYKNCSCRVCKRRKFIYVKKLLDFHRSKQSAIEIRTGGLIPSHLTLSQWWALSPPKRRHNVRRIDIEL